MGWDQVRGAAITLFVAFHATMILLTGACPAPDGSKRSDRDFLEKVAGDDADLRAFIVGQSKRWNELQKDAKDALEPYRRCCAFKQKWTMFTGTSRWARRVEIAVRVDGKWKNVFRQGEDSDRLYDFYRFRQYIRRARRGRDKGDWKRFTTFAAARALEQHPEADAARIRIMQGKIPTPENRAKRTRWKKKSRERVVKR